MAHRLRLGEAGKADRADAGVAAEPRGEGRGLFDVDAAGVQPAGFEDQRLLHVEGAVAGEGAAARRARLAWLGRATLDVHGSLRDLDEPRAA